MVKHEPEPHLSGWRDLNSRPLDPQRAAHRYPPCSHMLTTARLSANSARSMTVGDRSYSSTSSSLLSQLHTPREEIPKIN
jgi:hypothetical protein